MEHELELIIARLEILEIEVCNIIHNPGNIGNLSFSIFLDAWKYWKSDFSSVLGSWKYWKSQLFYFLVSWKYKKPFLQAGGRGAAEPSGVPGGDSPPVK